MNNFTFSSPTNVIFGKGTEQDVGKYVKALGNRVLLHYGGGSIKRNGLYEAVVKSLQSAGVEIVELGGVVPNPRYSKIKEGALLCRKENVDVVLAVGGGSVIDSAKGIAAATLIEEDEDFWDDYIMKKRRPTKALPIGVVLTIPAAGSETNRGIVITNDETHFKRSLGSDHMIPKFAIINPEYHYSLPNYHTACGCADIIAHLLERYFTHTTNVDFSDRLIEASLRTMIHIAPLALKNPTDYNVRAEIAWCGTLAHNGILGKGRTEDWGTHSLQHELGAIYDIIHGEGLAIMFPAWMKYVWKENPKRFVQYAMRVWDVDYAVENEEETILEGIRRTEVFFKELGLATRLSELNIDDSKFEEMAKKMLLGKETEGNFKKMTVEDAVNIYKLAQ